MKKRKKYKRRKKVNLKLSPKFILVLSIGVFFAVILGGIGYVVCTSDSFKVKDSDIISNMALNRGLREEIEGKSLFSINTAVISSNIIRGHPEYKRVSVSKEFPSTIIIEVEKRFPVAQIKGKMFYSVDKKAVVLSAGSSQPLPGLITIEIDSRGRLFLKGEHIDDRKLEYAFGLIRILKEEQLLNEFAVELINSVSLEAAYFVMEEKKTGIAADLSNEDIKVIVGEGEFSQKIKLLKSVISGELKDKLPLVKYIDLRYKKVYVGFKR
ncbi:MAG: FtsQ-type POTRA domain-containing protein [Candidatus Omnitrophota bacterium]